MMLFKTPSWQRGDTQTELRDQSKMRGYLASIARNLALKTCRRTGELSPLDDVLKREEVSLAEQALETIPAASLEPLILFYVEATGSHR